MYFSALARVGKILDRGNWSDRAFERALDFLEKFVERVADGGRNSHPKGHWGDRDSYRNDDQGDQPETSIEMEIGGTAEALGEHTLASAELQAEITDTEHASFAIGSGTFSAAAEGGAQYATTDAFCDVDGADFVFASTKTVTGKNWETTTTRVFAVDFAYLDMRNPLVITPECSYRVGSYKNVADGNVASVDFDVNVSGEHTNAEVQAGALAIEDIYSGSSIDATLAIG